MLPDMTQLRDTPASALTLAHLVYALHVAAILVGLFGSGTVIGSFVGSVPSIVAVILNYATRRDARGTWLESHYDWQVRTFWYALCCLVLAALAALTFIAWMPTENPLGPVLVSIGAFWGLTLWLIYRIGAGWMRLSRHSPMPV